MAREMQGERVPLLAREGEAPRLRVKDDGAAKASRWSRVAMMASGAVALGVVATQNNWKKASEYELRTPVNTIAADTEA